MSPEVAEAKPKKENRIGLLLNEYKGKQTTLCAGCGHTAITSSIIKAFHELGVEPTSVAKLSGIGCSSKTPAYFLNQAHGFNAVHGRMSTVATGSSMANRGLVNIGISGDGDTASIGLGNFLHMVRRNIPILYIVENNGCYGLTKGQFSATADKGSVKKGGKEVNENAPVDICALAIQMGCAFVGRSFSGDTQQVKALIEAGLAHSGTAVIDIVSPCVTFNNHQGSTKSVTYARQHEDPLHEIDFIPYFDDIKVDLNEGEAKEVTMHDGSRITLKKLSHEYDPSNKDEAMALMHEAEEKQLFYTGLVYYESGQKSFVDRMNLVDEPLATLPESRLRPSKKIFEEMMGNFK